MTENRRSLGRLALHDAHHAFGVVPPVPVMVQGQKKTRITGKEQGAPDREDIHPPWEHGKTVRYG
jgi:hypothetical protein